VHQRVGAERSLATYLAGAGKDGKYPIEADQGAIDEVFTVLPFHFSLGRAFKANPEDLSFSWQGGGSLIETDIMIDFHFQAIIIISWRLNLVKGTAKWVIKILSQEVVVEIKVSFYAAIVTFYLVLCKCKRKICLFKLFRSGQDVIALCLPDMQ